MRCAGSPRSDGGRLVAWLAATLLPALCVVVVAARTPDGGGAPRRDAVLRRSVPLTGAIATIADCGRGLVELRSLRTRWRPVGGDAPGPLELLVRGVSPDAESLDRFATRLRSHGFLGAISVGSRLAADAAIEFEVRLGSDPVSPAPIETHRAIVAMAESMP